MSSALVAGVLFLFPAMLQSTNTKAFAPHRPTARAHLLSFPTDFVLPAGINAADESRACIPRVREQPAVRAVGMRVSPQQHTQRAERAGPVAGATDKR